jgi:hypothetical protein
MDECAAGAVFAEYIIESVLGRGAIGAFGAAWPLDFGNDGDDEVQRGRARTPGPVQP